MPAQIKCPFCNQPFDLDDLSGGQGMVCPHCGKPSDAAPFANTSQHLHLIKNAPCLLGGKACPQCNMQISPDAKVCVHCGYNFATGKKTPGVRNFNLRRPLIRLGKCALLLLIAFVVYGQWPKIGPVLSSYADKLLALLPAGSPAELATPAPSAQDNAREGIESTAKKAVQPAEKAGGEAKPTADRALFEEKKVAAEKTIRWKLDSSVPLRKPGDKVELRRKNGQVAKGILSQVESDGVNGIVIVTTADGDARIELAALDKRSRIRIDPEYRERFIRNAMNSGDDIGQALSASRPKQATNSKIANGTSGKPASQAEEKQKSEGAPGKRVEANRPDGYPFRVFNVMFIGLMQKDGVKGDYAKFSVRNYTDQPLSGTVYSRLPDGRVMGSAHLSIPEDSSREGIYIRATKQCRLEIRSNRGVKSVQWGETK